MNRAIFVDRDNTIIEDEPLAAAFAAGGEVDDDPRLVRGAAHALGSLRQLGYHIVVVTNEHGVPHGQRSEDDVDALHQRIARLVHETSGSVIDRFYYCPFDPNATVEEYARDHSWRKPYPGMIRQAAEDLDLALSESWVIGDAEEDVEAGRAAGCQTVLVRRRSVNSGSNSNSGTETAAERKPSRAHFEVDTLAEAAQVIAQNRHRARTRNMPIVVTRSESSAALSERDLHDDESMRCAGAGAHRMPAVALSLGEIKSKAAVVEAPETTEALVGASSEIADDATSEKISLQADPPSESESPASNKTTPPGVAPEEMSQRSTHVEHDESDKSASSDSSMNHDEELVASMIASSDPSSESNRTRTAMPAAPVPPVRTGSSPRDSLEHQALTELLSEVRLWRASAREFTPARMFALTAMVLILFAAIIAAIYLEGTTAMAWVGTAIVAQLTVVGWLILSPRD